MSTWLITGSSTGLGRELARAVLEAGHNAVITARHPDSVREVVDGEATGLPGVLDDERADAVAGAL